MKYKEYIYQNFNNALVGLNIDSDELKQKVNNDEFKEELFYVCEKVSFIGINAPKMRVEGSTEVQGCFQYSDIDIAVTSAIQFISKYTITDIDELINIIGSLHMYAVSEENSKKAHATLFNDDWSMRFGAYHTFSDLPEDIFDKFKNYIKECIQNKKTPNSANSVLFANN